MSFDDTLHDILDNGAAVPTDHSPKKKPVSKSQALRFALHRLWELDRRFPSMQVYQNFEMYYAAWIDHYISEVEQRIADITFPPPPQDLPY